MLLAGDIGGTKTILAIVRNGTIIAEATYPSASYPDLTTIIRLFLDHCGQPITHASIGIAGPVHHGRAQPTNLPWTPVDAAELAATFSLTSVRLLNDLEAIAWAVPHLHTDDLHTLHVGNPERHAPIAVIAPGTGLGEAFLTWDGTRYQPHASEGGNTDFGPTNALEIELLRYMLTHHQQVSYELVCSGIGIPNLYAFLRDTGIEAEPAWLHNQLASTSDPNPIIINAALDRQQPCPIAQRTLSLFVSILAAEAGNLALNVLATGGVYIGGGIPPRILSTLEHPNFLRTFTNKGPFSDLMQRIPIHIIRNPRAALLGAAVAGEVVGR